jgi:outer membrane protein assembly factor BamB
VLVGVALVAAACGPPRVVPPGSTPTAPAGPTTTLFTSPPHLYAQTPLNGWGQDGIANSVDIAGNIVFVGGEFDEAVKGNQSAPRSNVMAVERTSGDLLPFVANTNGVVRVVLSDGFNTYIGGDFTTVNGVQRPRLAKVNAGTGALDTSFAPNVPVSVTDLLLVGNKLYVVGSFGQVNGVQRRGAALLDKGTGALNPTFSPNAQSRVNTVAISPNGAHVYLGLAGQTGPYLLDVNPVTGAIQGPDFSLLNDYIRDVTVGPDGTVYVAAGGQMNSAIAINPSTGRQQWRQRAEGDVQAVKYSNGYLFFGFHDGFTINGTRSFTLRLLAADPATGDLVASFTPESCCYPGVLTIDADGTFLAVGGLYARMGGRSVHGVSIHP